MDPSQRANKSIVEVLVVEDSPTQAERLKHLLEGNNYNVLLAANGKQALTMVRQHKPTLIISDIIMPEMDGFTLCRELKASKGLKDIPVILLTVLSNTLDIIKGLQCGADNFIRKPYDEKYLLSRVKYLLMNRELRTSERVQVGLKIRLEGQEHLITSERQQILDLLVSVYEEAIHLNRDLEERQRELARSYQSLNGLYYIADGLNKCTSVQDVAEKALERSLRLPGIRAGWIFFLEGEGTFRVPASLGLPSALQTRGSLEGDCLCRRMLLSGELNQAANVLECERLQRAADDTQRLRYHASVPLRADDRTLGIMNLAGVDDGLFSDEDLRTLYSVGNQVAVALERAQLYESLEQKVQERTAALRAEIAERTRAQEEAQRNLERIRALHEIDLAITSTLDLQSTLSVLLEKIDLVLPYAATTVRLLNPENGLLEPVACRNLDEKEWKAEAWRAGRGLANVVIQTNAPTIIRNAQSDPRVRDPEFYRRHKLVSYLGVPLIAKDKTLGVLGFYTKEEHEFTGDEIEFLQTLAGQAAIAIHNSQLYEEMVRANRVKDEFLSVMSHELRTPLNVVMGYAGLIKDRMFGEINAEQEKALEKIVSRANDQLTMTNSILYATSLEAKAVKVESWEVNLREFLRDLKSTYDVPIEIEKEVSLIWDYPSDLPAVKTDGTKLRHILQNLISNAIKFTEKGSVTVSAKITEGRKQKAESGKQTAEELPTANRLLPTGEARWVEFKVADTGVGIPKQHLPFIFEKFRQVDSSETRSYGGVGLGLYIAKEFTEMLGGRVEVESEPGKGATFTVRIPYEQ